MGHAGTIAVKEDSLATENTMVHTNTYAHCEYRTINQGIAIPQDQSLPRRTYLKNSRIFSRRVNVR